MALHPVPADKQPELPPYVVTSAEDAAAVLIRRRLDMGLTGEAIDYYAGLQERYTAKLENPGKPWGKRGVHISPMWEILAQTLGLVLVIMPRRQAEAIGALPVSRAP